MKYSLTKISAICVIALLFMVSSDSNRRLETNEQFLDRHTLSLQLPELADKSKNLPRMNRVHHLMPFTKWEHVRPCGVYVEEQRQFDQVLQCTNKKFFPALKTEIPRCFVITTDSPDVNTERGVNFIPLGLFNRYGFVGLYEPDDKTVYLVENVRDDNYDTYRHELLHYFLDLAENDGNAAHDHAIWFECLDGYVYAKKFKRLGR